VSKVVDIYRLFCRCRPLSNCLDAIEISPRRVRVYCCFSACVFDQKSEGFHLSRVSSVPVFQYPLSGSFLISTVQQQDAAHAVFRACVCSTCAFCVCLLLYSALEDLSDMNFELEL